MRYFLTRLAGLPLTLLAVTFLTFGILFLIPGDLVDVLAGDGFDDPEAKARMAAELGLDRPFLVQYLDWLGRAATGDLGRSTSTSLPVLGLILDRLGVTVQLAIMGTLLSIALGVAAGFLALRFRGRLIDRLVMAWAAVGMSIPGFVSATLMVLCISVFIPRLGVVSYVPFATDPGLDPVAVLPGAVAGRGHGGDVLPLCAGRGRGHLPRRRLRAHRPRQGRA